jgi:hypothetical protein
MGVTFASFQSQGTLPEFSDLLKIIDSGLQISFFIYFSTRGPMPSGPGVLFTLIFSSTFNMLLSVNSQSFKKVMLSGAMGISTKSFVSSHVKTEAKYLFNVSAISTSLLTCSPFSRQSGPMLLVITFF